MPGMNANAALGARSAALTLACFVCACLLPAAAQQGTNENSSGTLEVKVKKIRAAELAREFLKDPRRAQQAYITTPKQVTLGKMTGIPLLDPISGEVDRIQGKDVYLKTGTPKVRVLLRAKQTPAPLSEGKVVFGTGFVRSYRDGVVTIDVHRVSLTPPKETAKK